MLHRLLAAQFGVLDLPVYLPDCVPADARFPYLTLRIDAPQALTRAGMVSVTCWCRGSAAHENRLALADKLIRLVPTGGLPLWLEDGLAVLWPSGQGAVSWPEGEGVRGVNLPFDLTYYPNRRKEAAHA